MQTGGKVVILRMQGTDCNIESCFLCQSCMPAWRAAIAANKQTLAFRKGEVIFREGDKVQGIFFLYEGAVKVHQSWEEQKELILRFATAGGINGAERSMIIGEFIGIIITRYPERAVIARHGEFRMLCRDNKMM